jgi:hypothetical protein
MPATDWPTVTSTENAAMEMKNATIAYSIAVAPRLPICFGFSGRMSNPLRPFHTLDNAKPFVDDL